MVTRFLLAIRGSSSQTVALAAVTEAAYVLRSVCGTKAVPIICKAIYRVQHRKEAKWPPQWVASLIKCVRGQSDWQPLFQHNEQQVESEIQAQVKANQALVNKTM